jgi:hypothetical protein
MTVKKISGHWIDQPDAKYTVLVSLGSWNGIEDEADRNIFFYTDGEPIKVGDIVASDFVITRIH